MFERRQIGGVVDVEAEGVIAYDAHLEPAALRFCRVTGARPDAVGEVEINGTRDREHRIPVVVMVGNDHRDRRSRVVGDAVEGGGEREIGVHHDESRECVVTYPVTACVGRAVEGARIGDAGKVERSRPLDHFRRARDDHNRPRACRGNDPFGHRAGEVAARVVVERIRESDFPQRKRPQRDDDACSLGRAPGRHGVRMLPTVDPVYSVAKGVFTPWLRWGLHWTIEGEHHLPTSGPVILASNHVSYLDPLTLAWVADRRARRVRFLAKAELFEKPGLGQLLRAAHQIPVQRGRAEAANALSAGVDALERGECVAVFPEGTISEDLEPMAGKSGTARLARQTGVGITPVGLWGSHRILTKGRRPHWQWGVQQTAVVGETIVPTPDEHVKDTTDRMMAAIVECVARAREIYPADASDDDQWWWRDPGTAGTHRRSA